MLGVTAIRRLALLGAAATIVATACGDATGATPTPTDVGSGNIAGAGAPFPHPFYKTAFVAHQSKVPRGVPHHQAVGSGAGIQQFIKNTVDFGASDVPMGSADITSAGGPDALTQIPTTLGVISIAFNITGVNDLKLDADTLAGIFLGQIKTWND